MKRHLKLFAVTLVAGLGSASIASATDYIVGGGSGGDTNALFNISTDGKLGFLSSNDISLGYTVPDPDYSSVFESGELSSGVLFATKTALYYDFDATPRGHFLLYSLLPGDILFRIASYGDLAHNGEYIGGPASNDPNDVISRPDLHGFQQISISAAPEPSTWVFMIAGVGMIGTMLRYVRRKVGLTAA